MEEGVPQIPARYPTHGTQEQVTSSQCFEHGAITLFGPPFQGSCSTRVGLKDCLTTPHLPTLSGGIRFRLCCFHSPLLTASLLISFPAPTQMFQLRAFPIPTDHHTSVVRVLIRKSRAQRLHAPPPGLSQLGTSFLGLRAKPSTRRHSNAKTTKPMFTLFVYYYFFYTPCSSYSFDWEDQDFLALCDISIYFSTKLVCQFYITIQFSVQRHIYTASLRSRPPQNKPRIPIPLSLDNGRRGVLPCFLHSINPFPTHGVSRCTEH